MKSVMSVTKTCLYEIYSGQCNGKRKKYIQNLINDLIRAVANANTQQNEYLWQVFPTTRPATNLGALSNETNANTQQLPGA